MKIKPQYEGQIITVDGNGATVNGKEKILFQYSNVRCHEIA